jgi:hypothetical protein
MKCFHMVSRIRFVDMANFFVLTLLISLFVNISWQFQAWISFLVSESNATLSS